LKPNLKKPSASATINYTQIGLELQFHQKH